MTRPQDRGINLNTLLIAMSIVGAIVTTTLFIAPLKTLPLAQERMEEDVRAVKVTQAVQTENLRAITEVVRNFDGLNKRVDRLENTTDSHSTRLERLESRP